MAETRRNTALWRVLKATLFVAIVVGIGRALLPELRAMDWAQARAWRPEAGRLVVSLAVLIGVYVAHALLWRRILVDLGIARPAASTALRIYFVSSLGRYLPGKFWQLAGLAAMAGKAGIPAAGAAAASLLGQFAFLSTGLLFLAVQLPEFGRGAPVKLAGVTLVAVASLLWLLMETPAGHRGRTWLRTRLGPGAGERLGAAFELVERVRARDAVLWGVGYGMTWIALGFAFSLFATAFVPEATPESRRLAGTVAASYLAGYLVVVAPAGIGVREGAMTGLLAAVPGVPFAAAVVIAIWSRVWFTAAEVLPLAVLPFLSREPAAGHSAPKPADAPMSANGPKPPDGKGGAREA